MDRLTIKDADRVRDALRLYPFGDIKLDVEEWLSDPDNVAVDIDGNIGLLEECSHGVYSPHYFLKDRGKKGRDVCIQMLRFVFSNPDVKVLRPLTPVEHRAAIWMNRHLGFKDFGTVETWVGDCVIFMMTREEFFLKYGDDE